MKITDDIPVVYGIFAFAVAVSVKKLKQISENSGGIPSVYLFDYQKILIFGVFIFIVRKNKKFRLELEKKHNILYNKIDYK